MMNRGKECVTTHPYDCRRFHFRLEDGINVPFGETFKTTSITDDLNLANIIDYHEQSNRTLYIEANDEFPHSEAINLYVERTYNKDYQMLGSNPTIESNSANKLAVKLLYPETIYDTRIPIENFLGCNGKADLATKYCAEGNFTEGSYSYSFISMLKLVKQIELMLHSSGTNEAVWTKKN
jgi:hypothetical protein